MTKYPLELLTMLSEAFGTGKTFSEDELVAKFDELRLPRLTLGQLVADRLLQRFDANPLSVIHEGKRIQRASGGRSPYVPKTRYRVTDTAVKLLQSHQEAIDPPESIDELEKRTAKFNRTDEKWISPSRLVEVLKNGKTTTESLATRRSKGDKTADGKFGVEKAGWIWRKAGEEVFYLKSSIPGLT